VVDNDDRKAKARARRIQAQENRARAVELRKLGMSYADIGKQLDISAQAAHKTVGKAMTEVKTLQDADAIITKTMELEKLDKVEMRLWNESKVAAVPAFNTMLKVFERRAKLMGLDAPVKHANTNIEGTITLDHRIATMSDQEIVERLAELDEKLGVVAVQH